MFRSKGGHLDVTNVTEFYVHGTVQREFYVNKCPKRFNYTQFILYVNCSACFGRFFHPSSGAQITVSTSPGNLNSSTITTGRNNSWLVPHAVDTVICSPDDGWRNHPKHVEQFTDKINCVYLHPVGHLLIYWIKTDQLDVTCFIISPFTAQHVSNVSTSIFRSLRLIVGLLHVLYCSGSMCVGVTVWFGWGG